jgi:adenosylcobinamide kinase / adenosylcobinamide-phosphate guanylyltransferase
MLILIGGGVRSGKSAYALRRARALGTRRVYVATAEPLDQEMSARIGKHARERGAEFRTVEAPLDVVERLEAEREADVVVVDCLTLWLSNLLLRGEPEEAILGRVGRLIETLGAKPFHAILITNEVGMGVVPESALGRAFRDLCGRAHQSLATRADEIHFGALGTMIRLKPAPLTAAPAMEDPR